MVISTSGRVNPRDINSIAPKSVLVPAQLNASFIRITVLNNTQPDQENVPWTAVRSDHHQSFLTAPTTVYQLIHRPQKKILRNFQGPWGNAYSFSLFGSLFINSLQCLWEIICQSCRLPDSRSSLIEQLQSQQVKMTSVELTGQSLIGLGEKTPGFDPPHLCQWEIKVLSLSLSISRSLSLSLWAALA